MNFENTREFAKILDKQNELKHFRSQYLVPKYEDREVIYFTGNSLGLQPKRANEYVMREMDEWARLGGEGHTHAQIPWIPYGEIFPAQLSGIIGCKESEVVVMNSLTVNLHLMMVSFYKPTKDRFKIIMEYKSFPSDQYAVESQVRFHGFDPAEAIIEVKPREGDDVIRHEDIINTIKEHGDTVAMVLFGGVNYYTGQVFDMPAITETAHHVGAIAGFDLAHCVGNIELKMHDWEVDFACWCTYKYLNSGPGAIAGAFIHERHIADKSLDRFAGWWGYKKDTRFLMDPGFDPIPTAEGWQLSNAPILLMAVHKAALDVFEEAGMAKIASKGKELSAYLIYLLKDLSARIPGAGIRIITPENETERGCQVSFAIKDKGKQVFETLMQQGVSAGWREPEVIRVAPVPMYNTFEEVWSFVKMIEDILTTKN
jgi:kynureninase